MNRLIFKQVSSALCADYVYMNKTSIPDKREAWVRRTGLLIAIVASILLFVLVAYRMPFFHDELHGTIVGISEVHRESGSELVAAVQLDTETQILVPMPGELLNSQSNHVKIIERRTLSGRKSYEMMTSGE
jgi:hypothetical protein